MKFAAACLCFLLTAGLGQAAPAGTLDPTDLSVGQVGSFRDPVFRVIQIVNEHEMMVTPQGDRGRSIWIRGIGTRKIVDDDLVRLEGIFEVTGTKRYKTVIGGSRTVYLVEPESTEKKIKRVAAEEQERKKRQEDERLRAETQRKDLEEWRAKALAARQVPVLLPAEATVFLVGQGRKSYPCTILELPAGGVKLKFGSGRVAYYRGNAVIEIKLNDDRILKWDSVWVADGRQVVARQQ